MASERNKNDILYMQQAIKLARQAAARNEVPIGAVVVDAHCAVVARASNCVQSAADPLGHAEIRALRRAAKRQRDWRLDGYTLYVTLEPCALCMQVIIHSRIARVVYGAASPVYGFSLDKYCVFKLDKCLVEIDGDFCKLEAQQLLKDFFRKKRDLAHDRSKENNSFRT